MQRNLKAMLAAAGFLAVRWLTLVALSTLSAASDPSWDNLKHVTHRRTMTFATENDDQCTKGQLHKVTDQFVSIKVEGGKIVDIPRAQLLRVWDGHRGLSIVYSSRSSWTDVREMDRISEKTQEHVRVTTKAGKEVQGKVTKVTDSVLILRDGEQKTVLDKSDVARVVFVRLKPASDSAMYDAQESFYLDPQLWPYLLKIAPTMDVTLYDTALPEYAGTAACEGKH